MYKQIKGKLIPIFKTDNHEFNIEEITDLFLDYFEDLDKNHLEFRENDKLIIYFNGKQFKYRKFIFFKRRIFEIVEHETQSDINSNVVLTLNSDTSYDFDCIWNKQEDTTPSILIANELNNKEKTAK